MTPAATSPARHVVLVHGAWADGSGWRGVHDLLSARGYTVSIVQNPLTSFADDVAAVRRVLARQSGPVVLVGHSYAGALISEAGAAQAYQAWVDDGSGYARIMATRPQSIGYGLADSPAGQAAWIYEKFQAWSDNSGASESALAPDEMLDNIALYWFTNTATSSGRYYHENASRGFYAGRVELPAGVSVFPHEIFRAPRSWVERAYPNLIHWNELPRGGHFAAFEQPQLFVDELRTCFGKLRTG